MPEILLPSSTSIISSSSTASSLLLYNHPQLSRRKSLPLRRISGWQWLSRRISRQGLNATHALPNHTHHHHHTHNDVHDDCNYDNKKIIPDPQRRKTPAFDAEPDYEAEKEQARRTERDLAESYAAYCQSFTAAGLHQQHKRKTWMMDGLIEHASLEDEECVDEKRESCEPELQQPVLPPPQILTPSLYAEMRRAACDKKRARIRQRRLWSWSWFAHIRPRESQSH
ncbi:hypothetical protein CFD26_101287 [Aspergillus turcosus]|uniref:Uncharacterized protein n=1 Tax=Aspergillus turcosus TaxID=1245748 RepID=A0A3R7HQI2_9EURO|nr:hypothetical protein CFD26_101287 [Aspergillus turcosus]